jgi:rRNA-processing protein FCF1
MADETKKGKFDIFIARSIYPDAASVFTTHVKPLNEIKDDCYIVLDTNALLVPYNVGKESLAQIKTTYSALIAQKRLIIPAQVAREFAKNRANKIGELYHQLSTKRDSPKAIQTGRYPLLESVTEYQQALAIEEEVNKYLNRYREAVSKVLEHIEGWTWNDSVSLLYSELFTSELIADVNIEEEELRNDLFRRQLHKIPPGYKDGSKDDEGIGDLLIWQTILEVGRSNSKDVIFISSDEKPDWWHQSSKQALYPRYELIDEFRRESNGHTFHIVKFSTFLDLYGASEDVIEEVREKEIEVRTLHIAKGDREWKEFIKGRDAVLAWLKKVYPNSAISITESFPDFIVETPDGTRIAIEAAYFRHAHTLARRVRDFVSEMPSRSLPGFSEFVLVLVGKDEKAGSSLFYEFKKRSVIFEKVTVVIGYITSDGQFSTLQSTDPTLFS